MTGIELLMVSGSLRAGSTNSAVLRAAAEIVPASVAARDTAKATVFAGLADLPHFNPDDDIEPLPPAVSGLRAAVGRADALLISTPEYAGTLPGSFKNALDWLVGGTEITNKPTAWINVAPSPARGAGADATLRTVLGYVDADIVEAACTHIPVTRDALAPDGTIADPAIAAQVAAVVQTLVDHATS